MVYDDRLTIERLDLRESRNPSLVLPVDLAEVRHEESFLSIWFVISGETTGIHDAVAEMDLWVSM